jgi:hypothetical protein
MGLAGPAIKMGRPGLIFSNPGATMNSIWCLIDLALYSRA